MPAIMPVAMTDESSLAIAVPVVVPLAMPPKTVDPEMVAWKVLPLTLVMVTIVFAPSSLPGSFSV